MASVLDTNRKHSTDSLAFLDPNGGVAVQRYDMLKYRQFDKLTENQLGYFWRPDEIDLTKDASDYKLLSDAERRVVTLTLSRQILLDSVQGRAPNLAFLPIVSLPELEAWITTWSFSETIHSRSYTHILRNVFPDPSKVFDTMMDIEELVDCASDISDNYDKLIRMSSWYQLLGEGTHTVNGEEVTINLYELKKLLWLAIMSVNILEGVRFYASFVLSFVQAENKKLNGNASIIKLICRDENLHLAATQSLLKVLPKEDADYVRIAEETREQSIALFKQAVEQEEQWCDFIFDEGSIIGLNAEILKEYVRWTANKRMVAVGLPSPYKGAVNSLPWMQKWIAGSDVQIAPQEQEKSEYIVGGTKLDVTDETFKDFSL